MLTARRNIIVVELQEYVVVDCVTECNVEV
jgi:hypothetical protein